MNRKIEFFVGKQKVKGTLILPNSIKSKLPAVLLIHGWTSSEKGYIPRAQAISKLGYICLTFNLRGHGNSDGELDKLSRRNHLQDVIAAYDFLASQKGVEKDRIGVIGSSYGGYMASLLSVKRRIKWLVLRAPAIYSDKSFTTPSGKINREDSLKYFNIKTNKNNNLALKSLSKYRGDVLLITSGKDEIIPKQTIQNYIDAINHEVNFDHLIIKGANHAFGKNTTNTKWLKQFIGILENYFKEKLKIDLSNRKNMFYWQTNRPLTAVETKDIFISRHHKISSSTIRKIISYGMQKAGFRGENIKVKKLGKIIKQGSVNTVIPAELASGQEVVIRIHPENVKNGYFYAEKVATSLVRKIGIPVYKTIYVDDIQSRFPYDFMIMSREKGCPIQDINLSDSNLEQKLVVETGKYAALIHKIKPKGFGFFNNQIAKSKNVLIGQYKSFKEHIFAALFEDLKFLTDNRLFKLNQSKKIEKLFKSNSKLMNIKKGSLIHNDIADWNELSDRKHVTGIMDWDECFSGDPIMELSAYSLFYGEPRLTWFKEGYNQINELEENEDKFQLFKLRYLISKMHLRKKRSLIDPSSIMKRNITRGMEAMKEVFRYFQIQ